MKGYRLFRVMPGMPVPYRIRISPPSLTLHDFWNAAELTEFLNRPEHQGLTFHVETFA